MNPSKRPLPPFLVLGLLALLSGFFLSRLPQLEFDYNFEALFPNENQELKRYEAYRNQFEHDNEFILLAIEQPEGIFRKPFLLEIDALYLKLKSLPYILQVECPTRLTTFNLDGLIPVKQALMHPDEEERYKADSSVIYNDPDLVGSFFPADGKSICLFIRTEVGLSKAKSDALANAIEELVKDFPEGRVHYAGRIFAQKVYLEQLQHEFVVFIALAFVFVLLLLWFSFRSAYGTVVPVMVVVLAVIWTLGLMQLFGKKIDIMCSMLPTMIFVAGMSDVIHFYSKYRDDRIKGRDSEQSLKQIRREVAYPTFLTLLSTVIGFLSLLFSSIQPVRDFGLYTSLGVSLAYLLTYTFLPSIIRLYPPAIGPEQQSDKALAAFNMRRGIHLVLRNPSRIAFITVLVLLLSLVGLGKLRINNFLLEDLNDKVKVKQDFTFFDTHYSGARPFELSIVVKKDMGSVWDYDNMRALHQLDSFVRKNYGAGFVLSPPGLVMRFRAMLNGGAREFPDEPGYADIQGLLLKNRKNKDFRRIVDSEGYACRISAKFRDLGSAETSMLNDNLQAFISGKGIDKRFDLEITGAAHLIDRNNAYMVENMLQGFAFSIVLISVLTFMVHRSWRMVLIFLLPNLVPLLVVSGFMGWMGIELKTATSLVFSIAFGIATDDTIHFISRLKLEVQSGKSILYAFKRTYIETGKPILLTTFILAGGFSTLLLSNFQSIWYFGFLICITVLVALLADLFLLPVMLFWIYKKPKS